MLNQIVLVGRIESFKDGEINNKKVCQITLAIPASTKDENGEYITNHIPILLKNSEVIKNTKKMVSIGCIIGVKGSIESIESNKKTSIYLVGEKITFLSSGGASDEDE